jgi:hypothetical protein
MDDEAGEHYIPLRFEFKADPIVEREKCVKPSEINEAIEGGHRFRQTAFGISHEMANAIYDLLRKKHTVFGNNL